MKLSLKKTKFDIKLTQIICIKLVIKLKLLLSMHIKGKNLQIRNKQFLKQILKKYYIPNPNIYSIR